MAETRLIIVPDQYVFLASLKNRGFSIGGGHPYSGLKYDSPEFLAPEFLDSEIFWVDLKKAVKPSLQFLGPYLLGGFFRSIEREMRFL